MAWSIVNDSFYSPQCILYPPYTIAVAAIFITFQLHPATQPSTVQPNWWHVFDTRYLLINCYSIAKLILTCSDNDLDAIVHFLTTIYSGRWGTLKNQ